VDIHLIAAATCLVILHTAALSECERKLSEKTEFTFFLHHLQKLMSFVKVRFDASNCFKSGYKLLERDK